MTTPSERDLENRAMTWKVETCRRCDTLHVRGDECRSENFATDEDYALLNRAPDLLADNDRLRAALKLVEYGSCDGCSNKAYCVECGADLLHDPDCAVGIALGRCRPHKEGG